MYRGMKGYSQEQGTCTDLSHIHVVAAVSINQHTGSSDRVALWHRHSGTLPVIMPVPSYMSSA
jgi:hypothetical protein